MTDPFDFSGMTVLVTGGARGLGRAVALGFAQRGASMILASRDVGACECLARQIIQDGGIARALELHVERWEDIDGFVDRAFQIDGQVDVLVNNAAIQQMTASSVEMTEAAFDELISVNLKGPFRLSATIGARMAASSGGSIINISSLGSIRPLPAYGVYAATKAALNALTTAHAFEFAPKVRVNAILPGAFETDMAADWTEERKRNIGAALGRNGQPEDLVTTALYLASPASNFTTGAMIKVDGGRP